MKHVFSDAETRLGTQRGNDAQKLRARNNLVDVLTSKGFKLIGEYKGTDQPVIIECLRCGETKTITPHSIRRDGTSCLNCKRTEIQKAKEQDEINRKRIKEELKEEKKKEKTKAINERISAQHICKVCGTPYSISDYMSSTGMKYKRNSGFCSAKCRDVQREKLMKEAAKRRGVHSEHHYDRAIRLGLPAERGVTLKKLFKRDNGICQICGLVCEYAGNPLSDLYPSIDHIIPMNNDPDKKGGHTWANVQLAHRLCNSNKRDYVGEKWNNLKPTGKG